jgi:hypothetical protein
MEEAFSSSTSLFLEWRLFLRIPYQTPPTYFLAKTVWGHPTPCRQRGMRWYRLVLSPELLLLIPG